MKGKILNSPLKIQNSPFRPPKTLQAHHIRHIISGTLVFLLGIAANEALMFARRRSPRKVRWTAIEVQHDYVPTGGLPGTNVQVEMGLTEDGTVVWRTKKDF
jgi:hypothetical protein